MHVRLKLYYALTPCKTKPRDSVLWGFSVFINLGEYKLINNIIINVVLQPLSYSPTVVNIVPAKTNALPNFHVSIFVEA